MYSNSFISPNSAREIDFRIVEEQTIKTSVPENIQATNLRKIEDEDEGEKVDGTSVDRQRVERSADPILSKTSAVDNLLLFKNIEESLDSNDVELSGRIGHFIQPSKTVCINHFISKLRHCF